MAAIAITTNTPGPTTLARTTLSASDTLAFVPKAGMYLTLANNTAGALTATLVGSTAPAAYVVPGTGGTTLNLAAGKAILVGANSTVEVALDELELYLQGNITVTGGTGLIATVLTD